MLFALTFAPLLAPSAASAEVGGHANPVTSEEARLEVEIEYSSVGGPPGRPIEAKEFPAHADLEASQGHLRMSVQRLAALLRVAPEHLEKVVVKELAGPSVTLSKEEVVSEGSSEPYFELTGPEAESAISFVQPQAGGERRLEGSKKGTLYVTLWVDGGVLELSLPEITQGGVATTEPLAGEAVHFSTPRLVNGADTEDEPRYRWRFGEGKSSAFPAPLTTYEPSATDGITRYDVYVEVSTKTPEGEASGVAFVSLAVKTVGRSPPPPAQAAPPPEAGTPAPADTPAPAQAAPPPAAATGVPAGAPAGAPAGVAGAPPTTGEVRGTRRSGSAHIGGGGQARRSRETSNGDGKTGSQVDDKRTPAPSNPPGAAEGPGGPPGGPPPSNSSAGAGANEGHRATVIQAPVLNRSTPVGLVGVLLSSVSALSARAIDQTLARGETLLGKRVLVASNRAQGAVGPLSWILGITTLLLVVILGAVRELEPRSLYRRLTRPD